VRPSESVLRYTRTAIALHWLIAAALLFQIAWGWWMQEIPKQPPGVRADAFNLHKSIGLTIFALMTLRLGWRLRHPAPPLPPMPRWQAALARCTHAGLYAALLIQPLVGYLGSVFSGYRVKYFGMTLPAWGMKHDALKDVLSGTHLAVSWLIVALVLLHVAGAAKHAFVDRDGLLRRMGVGTVPARDGPTVGVTRSPRA
jgi:cytochrome b561